MSEDEIIKYIKNENEIDIDTRDFFKDNKESQVYKELDECIKAHHGLLDLYQHKKGRIDELKQELLQEKEKNKVLDEKLKMSIAMLTKGTYPETEKGANDFDNYFISKDKIRAKIKELKEKSEYWNCDEIQILKELLERR